jgi:hypothetical protein
VPLEKDVMTSKPGSTRGRVGIAETPEDEYKKRVAMHRTHVLPWAGTHIDSCVENAGALLGTVFLR